MSWQRVVLGEVSSILIISESVLRIDLISIPAAGLAPLRPHQKEQPALWRRLVGIDSGIEIIQLISNSSD